MKLFITVGCVEDDSISETALCSFKDAEEILRILLEEASFESFPGLDNFTSALDKALGDAKAADAMAAP